MNTSSKIPPIQYFRYAILFIIFLEILSYGAYLYPLFNKITFLVILFITLVLALEKLEYGLYVLLAELFIGSKGYLFYFEAGGISVSIRIALFLIIMSVWLASLVQHTNRTRIKMLITTNKLLRWYYLLFIFILWGVIWGILRGNSFNNVFFDFNAWIYFALIFVFFDQVKSLEQIKNILAIFVASLITITLKTVFLLFMFAHRVEIALPSLYRWVRTSGVGEITQMDGNFYRIFFQTQIYSLVGFFIVFALLFFYWKSKGEVLKPLKVLRDRKITVLTILTFLTSLTVLISFSRSFWVGIASGVALLLTILKFKVKISWMAISKLAGALIILLFLEIGIVYVLINFPKPASQEFTSSFASLIEERVTEQEEAAGISRINLLRPLFKEISQHPLIGSGYGSTVTYRSSDPRVLARSKEGWYTTYAFEWGYLDIWLKIGLFGLLAYLVLLWKIFQNGWGIIRFKVQDLRFKVGSDSPSYQNLSLWSGGENEILRNGLVVGLLVGLVALLVTNGVSPYLNHPLGIGYIMLTSVIFDVLRDDSG